MARREQRRAKAKSESAKRREAHRERAKTRGRRRIRARPIVPGARYKITKRCLERRFFLAPDSDDVQCIIGFCLGLCLQRFGMQLHAAVFMSNHYHLDITDPNGEMPAFKCMLNSFIARSLNALRGRFDKFWSADQACDVEFLEDEDLLQGMAYTLANPVKAGLVRRAQRWPGLTTAGQTFGSVMRFERPKTFFDPDNRDVPDAVEVSVVRPDVFRALSDAELDNRLDQAVRDRELAAAHELATEHRRFLGESRIVRQKWRRAPGSHDERFAQRPSFSSRNKWARIAALQRNATWDAAYAKAYDALLSGEDVEFPRGSYALRRFAGVRVAQAPP